MQPCTAKACQPSACAYMLEHATASLYICAVRSLVLAGTRNMRQALQKSSLTEKSSSSSRPPSPPSPATSRFLFLMESMFRLRHLSCRGSREMRPATKVRACRTEQLAAQRGFGSLTIHSP